MTGAIVAVVLALAYAAAWYRYAVVITRDLWGKGTCHGDAPGSKPGHRVVHQYRYPRRHHECSLFHAETCWRVPDAPSRDDLARGAFLALAWPMVAVQRRLLVDVTRLVPAETFEARMARLEQAAGMPPLPEAPS